MKEGAPTTTLVIFGVTGDLSRRKLLPALAEICQNSDIKSHLKILGISRRHIELKEVLPKNAENLARQFDALQMDYAIAEDYQKLKRALKKIESEQVIFYFAV